MQALRDRAVKTGRAEAETLCNDQWMDVGSRPTFFVLIIVSTHDGSMVLVYMLTLGVY